MELADVQQRLRRKNQILFSRESPCLQPLRRAICGQDHRTLALWALDCAQTPADVLAGRYPRDPRPQRAIDLCRLWMQGEVTMPRAKAALLECHAMARDLIDPADIARCHAVGQACAAVHVETHAIGLAIYELTALVREHGLAEEPLAQKLQFYQEQLERCTREATDPSRRWAAFLTRPAPNKEALLWQAHPGPTQ